LISQAKARSMTHRRGSGSKRGKARGRLTMDSERLAFSFAHTTSLPVYPPPAHPGSDRGYLKLYIDEVTQADQGCDFAFCLPPAMR